MNATSSRRTGRLLLIPNTLDLGCVEDGSAPPDIRDALPLGVLTAAAGLQHWVAENAKTTRAFLKRVNEVVPLSVPVQAQQIEALPRPAKGGGKGNAQEMGDALLKLLMPALEGHDIGLISEAGLPAVADPGSALVKAAHQAGIEVVPFSGPTSLLLALAASGLHGQSFAFAGYLPTEAAQRAQRIKDLETVSRRLHQTQLAIETPYRNAALWEALVQHLQPTTQLSVACGLTLPSGFVRTATVAHWRQQRLALPDKVPAVFSWLAA